MPFIKGQSGNPRGRRAEKPFRDALRLELAALGEDQKALREVARKMIERGRKGDLQAATVIRDTLDGKPAQAITNGEDGEPFEVVNRIERVVVSGGAPANAQADNEIMRELIGAVRDGIPDAGERTPQEIAAMIRGALKARG